MKLKSDGDGCGQGKEGESIEKAKFVRVTEGVSPRLIPSDRTPARSTTLEASEM